MTTATLADRLASRSRADAAQAMRSYLELVGDHATGADIDAERAAGILTAAGKTARDLDVAAALYRRRLALAEEVKRGPAAKARLAELDARRIELRTQRQAMIAEFNKRLAPLDQEAGELQRIIERADREAPRELVACCPYRDRHEAVTAAQRAVEAARADARQLRTKATEYDRLAARNEYGDGFVVTPANKEAARRHRGEAERLRGEARELDAKAAGELTDAVRLAEGKLLEP